MSSPRFVNHPRVALLQAVALLAMLLGDTVSLLRMHTDRLAPVGIGVQSPIRSLDASAPSKAWESPSLQQTVRKHATPATVASTGWAANPGTHSAFITTPHNTPSFSALPRPASPRGPPARSISL